MAKGQSAISKAYAAKDKRWHIYRGGFRGATKDYRHSFFCHWKGVSIKIGADVADPDYKGITEAEWSIFIGWWPLNHMFFKVWKRSVQFMSVGEI